MLNSDIITLLTYMCQDVNAGKKFFVFTLFAICWVESKDGKNLEPQTFIFFVVLDVIDSFLIVEFMFVVNVFAC